MSSAGVVFDGDDTLWETAPLYSRAKQRFFGQMSSLGFDALEVETAFHNIDVANVDRFGFSKHRFPTSMAETYRLFCARRDSQSDLDTERSIRRIGYSVFDEVAMNSDYAEYVLAKVRPYYKLILATRGDEEVQRTKIERSGLAHFFDAIYVLAHKTTRELHTIARECELDILRSWIIGDSLRSDINPGLGVGFKAIWIPKETWAYEHDEETESERLFKVHTLADILKLLIPEKT